MFYYSFIVSSTLEMHNICVLICIADFKKGKKEDDWNNLTSHTRVSINYPALDLLLKMPSTIIQLENNVPY